MIFPSDLDDLELPNPYFCLHLGTLFLYHHMVLSRLLVEHRETLHETEASSLIFISSRSCSLNIVSFSFSFGGSIPWTKTNIQLGKLSHTMRIKIDCLRSSSRAAICWHMCSVMSPNRLSVGAAFWAVWKAFAWVPSYCRNVLPADWLLRNNCLTWWELHQ